MTVRAFHAAVETTLEAPSYLYGGDASLGPIEYWSPNRTSDLSSSNRVIVIGRKSYQELSASGNVVIQWGEGPLTTQISDLFGPVKVKSLLRDLAEVDSVRRERGGFIAEQIVDANVVSPGSAGQSLIVWTVDTRGGFVVSCKGTAYGLFQILLTEPKVVAKAVTAKSLPLGSATYSKIGIVPRITAPPKRDTVKLVPCRNGNMSDYGSSGYVCGTFGT
jgi:hypothetical protein